MIENVLEIKDTHVREVMTPLVDVVAIDASGSLVDFHSMWVTHQYSRYHKISKSLLSDSLSWGLLIKAQNVFFSGCLFLSSV